MTVPQRWSTTKLNALTTDIRLKLPEAYKIHRKILDWESSFSVNGIPAKSLGLDPLTLKLMRRVMKSWTAVKFMNRYFGGTAIPRIQLDVIPGILCAAHFAIFRKSALVESSKFQTYLETGMRLQRFWLTATSLGISLQPSLAPLCFSHYIDNDRKFDGVTKDWRRLRQLSQGLKNLLGARCARAVFMGRIGYPANMIIKSRSIRVPLNELIEINSETE
jgi:hypothetical protein